MNRTGARLSRRAVLGTAVAGLCFAAALPFAGGAEELPAEEVTALAFDGTALVVAADGLWRMEAGAPDWTPFPGKPGEISALAAHPGKVGRLFAGTWSGRVLVSEDGGASWTEPAGGLPGGSVNALVIAAQDPDTVYAAVEGDGLWASKDVGQSWELAMDRPFEDGAERDLLTLASVNAGTGMGGIWIYAGTEVGLVRVPDCFCRWQDVQPGDAMDALVTGESPPPTRPLPEGEGVRSLAAAPIDSSPIYAGLASGLWKSTDAGVNWAHVDGAPIRLVAVNPGDPDHVVAVTEAGIMTSRDGGLTWTAPGA